MPQGAATESEDTVSNLLTPQVLEACASEFGMVEHGEGYAIVAATDYYCSECDAEVKAMQPVVITFANDEEVLWDEEGDEFCGSCGGDTLYRSEEDYDDYLRDQADDMAFGLWHDNR